MSIGRGGFSCKEACVTLCNVNETGLYCATRENGYF